MIAPSDIPFQIDPETASSREYDVVIVGSGVSGSIIAKQVSEAGYRVLVVEAGPGNDVTVRDYERNLLRFYEQVSKDNNAPYAKNRNAPMPRSYETQKLEPGQADDSGYLVQKGPFEIDSTYSRVLGGTTRHWEGKALRMLPDDFSLRSRFGRAMDWPVSYEKLQPYYEQAENELGVSGDVEDQSYGGLAFPEGYVYPMHKMPLSYLDQRMAKELDGTEVELGGEKFSLKIRSTPQARNGIPNPAYNGGRGFEPTGAVSLHQTEMGQRCQGNTNCVPICPVQAKYDARRTLFRAIETERVDILPQAVASKVEIDPETGRVTGVHFRAWTDPDSSVHKEGVARGKVFVLAANAVENARLMLASDLKSSSGLVGRNLMDHAYLLTWALMPEVVGALRGPLCTSGIEDLRTGAFRKHQAAFRAGIHNDGWGWATASPYTDLDRLVDEENRFGPALRHSLVDQIARQVLLAFMVEVLPEESNRITVDPRWTDALGNPRPVISYNIPEYTMEGIAFARRLSRRIYQRIGAEDHTRYTTDTYGCVSYEGINYVIRGGNHWAGTHLMGTSAEDSVVNEHQRSWDHENLYLAGAGSMPSIGTANTTLTLSALCFISAEKIVEDLQKQAAPISGTSSEAAA